MGKLTDIKIKNIETEQKPKKYSDGEGLFLYVTKSGKYFRYSYRFAKKQKTLSIGVYPKISLKKARNKHQNARELLEQGIDPGQLKKIKKEANIQVEKNTFGQLTLEWFSKQTWADSTKAKQEIRIKKEILPFLGDRPAKKITPTEILNILIQIQDRGTIDTAHRVKQIISRVFRYGISKEVVDSDPCRDLSEALTTYKSIGFSAITTPKKVGGLLRTIDTYTGSAVVRAALKLAPLVFLRPGELRQGEWKEISFDEKLWRIPGPRMKARQPHIVPLSRQALDILKTIQLVSGSDKYIFPSLRTKERPISDNSLNGALRRLDISKEEHTMHGFRKTASTLLHEQGYKTEHIEMQLAHKDPNIIRGIYNHAQYLPQRKKMMQKWADYLDKLKNNK